MIIIPSPALPPSPRLQRKYGSRRGEWRDDVLKMSCNTSESCSKQHSAPKVKLQISDPSGSGNEARVTGGESPRFGPAATVAQLQGPCRMERGPDRHQAIDKILHGGFG